jgi:hypothetical protein
MEDPNTLEDPVERRPLERMSPQAEQDDPKSANPVKEEDPKRTSGPLALRLPRDMYEPVAERSPDTAMQLFEEI